MNTEYVRKVHQSLIQEEPNTPFCKINKDLTLYIVWPEEIVAIEIIKTQKVVLTVVSCEDHSKEWSGTLRVESEQFGEVSRSSRVPSDVRRDGASSEDRDHVLDSVWVLRVLF